MRRTHALIASVASVATLATTALLSAPAQAGVIEPEQPVYDQLSQPLQVQGYPGGALVPNFTSQSTSEILAVSNDGSARPVVPSRNGAISGLDLNQTTGDIAFTQASGGSETAPPTTALMLAEYGVQRAGAGAFARGLPAPEVSRLANLSRFEARRNPDQVNTYGIRALGSCDVPRRFRANDGGVESNPYAVARTTNGWYVADAAGNDILKVTDGGAVSVAAVLPVQRYRLNQARVDELELPDCAVGKVLRVEPVPTDVEVAPQGGLFVSLLPGGEYSFTRGRVVKVNPATKNSTVVAKGFASATNVALNGQYMYVADLFGNTVWVVDRRTGEKSRGFERQLPAAVDVSNGTLWTTANIFEPGAAELYGTSLVR